MLSSIRDIFNSKNGAVFCDFDGVLTSNKVYVSDLGREMVRCCKYDSMGIKLLREFGVPIIVVSSETNDSVRMRCEKLGVEAFCGVWNKGLKLREISQSRGIDLGGSIFIGNDTNDIAAGKETGLFCVPYDAHPECKERAHFILSKNGGDGALRELIDVLLVILKPSGG